MTEPTKVALTYVSATQISTYRLCPRKWGYRKLDRIQAPPNKYAAAGTAIHKLIEAWLVHGTAIPVDTPHGKMAMPGLKHLPAPKTAEVEKEMKIFTDDDIVYVLKIDVTQPFDGNLIRVWDHKTTSDFKWAKTPAKLAVDEQAIIYATAVIMAFFETTKDQTYEDAPAPPIEMNWVYYRRSESKPGSKKVQLRVLPSGGAELDDEEVKAGRLTYSYVEKQFGMIHETALELKRHQELGHKAKDLPYDIEGCNAFGGCPYRGDPCKLTPTEILRGALKQVNILEQLKAAKEKGAVPASTTKPSAEANAAAEDIKNNATEEAAAAEGTHPTHAQVNPPEEPTSAPASSSTVQKVLGDRLHAASIIAASMANSNMPEKDIAKRTLAILTKLEVGL